jgi:hypothetical protein
MERKRRLALICATVGVALGAGHLVQNGATSDVAQLAPTQVEQVSAGPASPDQPAAPVAATALPVSPVLADLGPGLARPARPTAPVAAAPATGPTPLEGPAADPMVVTAPANGTVPAPVAPVSVAAQPASPDTCAPSLRLAAAPQAMIGISLVTPCAPDTRVVIAHEGLSITAKTNAQGMLFLSLPALAVEASVSARLPDGAEVAQTVRVPAMATLRRMGVQWHDADAFQLHAFENGANYGEPGHVSAAKPQTPTTGLAGSGGFVTVLGDASVETPMLAEIYTFPAGIAANADILIEAAVTDATCGRELLGETIMTLAGDVYITELTLAMPGCDAVGDILVLKNLLTDLTIAAAN